MIKRKLFVVLTALLLLGVQQTIKAQTNNNIVPILLNEYSASNVGTPVDNYGEQSDWVEIHNAHTALVSLSGYYLSNDRNNLYKWKFPSSFIMGVNTYSVVWLSGRNTVSNGNYHANFTLDQCKNEWLILTSPQGKVYDSVFVQKTKAGHSWGRVDEVNSGIGAWRLYTAHSFMYANPLVNNYRGYAPKPIITAYPAPTPNAATAPSVNAGGFYTDPSAGAPLIYFKLESPTLAYDTVYHSCFNIYYTTDGSYPIVGVNQVYDSISTVISVSKAAIIRAIAVINPTATNCSQGDYLPSFCETNTYFVDPLYQTFDSDFGVLSIAMPDTLWLLSSGNPPNSPVHVEYYDKQKQVTEGYGLLNRPPNESWATLQRGFNITIDDKQGFGCNFEGNIFNVEGLGTSSRTEFPTLQLYAGDNESHSTPNIFSSGTATTFGTGLRDVFMQSLSTKYNLNVNPLHVKPVLVFRNGAYWGTFTLKEVYDKYYENYYHQQSKDSLDLPFYYNTDGYVSYDDGSVSRFLPTTSFKTTVYDVVINRPMTVGPYYTQISNLLDLSSLMDYMIVNSYALNSDLWNYNIAYGKGGLATKPGNKWHYSLWNMPSIFNFTAVPTNTFSFGNPTFSTCVLYSNDYAVSPQFAGNGHGAIMRKLMRPAQQQGSAVFQQAYIDRYQDVLNTAFKCDNILKHFDYVYNLYMNEMRFHEDPANFGAFSSAPGVWDTNMVHLRSLIEKRCLYVGNSFNTNGCFGLSGPYNITVDVQPSGAGSVKLNSILLDSYPWSGNYYEEKAMSFKAIPTNTTYIFHHWEFKNSHTLNSAPLSLDSVAVSFSMPDEVVAVFTDKSKDVEAGVNVPTGFTPNGDGKNDVFGPLGSALFTSDYEMTVWNRWGQEVFRSLSPDSGWDGNYKGQQAITGVYAYIIKYKNIYGEDKLLKGNVTLTR